MRHFVITIEDQTHSDPRRHGQLYHQVVVASSKSEALKMLDQKHNGDKALNVVAD